MSNLNVELKFSANNISKITSSEFNNSFKTVMNEAYKEISARVQEKLIENMIKYDVDSMNILSGLNITVNEKGVLIDVNCEYAIFIEYGTGIVGSQNPHPQPKRANWHYGDGGWWYPTNETIQSRYPLQKTKLINGQLYAYTKGQKSKPFMYDTYLWASRSINNIIRKHISNFTKNQVKGWFNG